MVWDVIGGADRCSALLHEEDTDAQSWCVCSCVSVQQDLRLVPFLYRYHSRWYGCRGEVDVVEGSGEVGGELVLSVDCLHACFVFQAVLNLHVLFGQTISLVMVTYVRAWTGLVSAVKLLIT